MNRSTYSPIHRPRALHRSIWRIADDIRLPFERKDMERSVSFEPRAGRVTPRHRNKDRYIGSETYVCNCNLKAILLHWRLTCQTLPWLSGRFADILPIFWAKPRGWRRDARVIVFKSELRKTDTTKFSNNMNLLPWVPWPDLTLTRALRARRARPPEAPEKAPLVLLI